MIWAIWAITRPIHAFIILVFVWITIYSRSTVPFFQVEGPGNRGGIALGDLLWLSFIISVLFKSFLKGIRLPKSFSINFYVLFIFPYILLATLLPIMGIVFGNWPISYGLSGIRQLQWVSFSIISYWLTRNFGFNHIIYPFFKCIFWTTLLHTSYSILQTLASMNVISWKYLFLDQIFIKRFPLNWFFYPRTTGLLVNPNSFGLFGAMLFMIFSALILSGLKLNMIQKILIVSGAIYSLLTSGSRSAVLGILVAFIVYGYSSIMNNKRVDNDKSLVRILKLILLIAFIMLSIILILPDSLQDRFFKLKDVILQGVNADPNAIGRVQMWVEAIDEYWRKYPLGTWVPPSYVLWLAVDSYYVNIFTQGTIIYLMSFILFLFGNWLLGFSLINRQSEIAKFIGFALIGFLGVIEGASFTLSPLLEPQINTLFWSFLGFGIAEVKRRAYF